MPRVALYSHDTMGLGHMRRSLAIAEAIAAAGPSTILLVAGAREAGLFAVPEGADTLALPAVFKQHDGTYTSRSLRLSLSGLIRLRAETLQGALRAFAPDVLIVDKVPGGVADELKPSLRMLRARGTRIVLGLRDVLDEPRQVMLEWAQSRAFPLLRECYDAIWVYGDRRVCDPVADYGLPPDVAAVVRYTGYLGRRAPGERELSEAAQGLGKWGVSAQRMCLCLVGGGQDGYALASAFARADLPAGAWGLIVTGPFMPPDARRALSEIVARRERVSLLSFVPDLDVIVHLASRVVSMGGYNTVCEVLAAAKPALIVPRIRPRREQLLRAQRLHQLGLLDVLEPGALSPDAITTWLGQPASDPATGRLVELDGLARLPGLLSEALATPTVQPTDVRIPA